MTKYLKRGPNGKFVPRPKKETGAPKKETSTSKPTEAQKKGFGKWLLG